jgi:glycerophosphoryl diester phosphodiesterase
MSDVRTTWPYPRWIAHRGAGRIAPENTLAAFRCGAAHGYRMFECDVKLSADGVPFLMHDTTLQRTTGGTGLGGDRPWSELSRLDAGGWHSRLHAGEPLPSFENVARFCLRNGHFLNIEIKPTPDTDEAPGIERRTGEVVAREAERLWAGTEVPPLLSSFRPESLAGARDVAPRVPRALLLDTLRDGWLDEAPQLECVAVVCNQTLWDAVTVARAKDAGLRTLSYTVNVEESARRLLALGIDGIITDRIDLFGPAD